MMGRVGIVEMAILLVGMALSPASAYVKTAAVAYAIGLF
jgi:hypothetical protein